MNEKTKKYLKIKFREYYERNRVLFPERGESREWGFIFFDPLPDVVMQRHVRMRDEKELKEYLVEKVPAHAFYSVALYRTPDAPNMKSKGWEGATLIFDLDAEKSTEKSYREALQEMKEEIIKLQEILQEDFGLSKKHMLVVFSGSKGYHLHVSDKAILSLGSAERREIVSYMKAIGLKPEMILKGNFETPWIRRVRRTLGEILKEIDEEEILKNLPRGKRARKVVETLKKDEVIKAVFQGKGIPKGKLVEEALLRLTKVAISKSSVNLDEPVTADIHRLIRLPNSLHGGSSLRTTPVRDLDSFDPLVHAVVFMDETVKVNVLSDVKIEMMEQEFRVHKGVQKLPEYVAIHLLCRGVAEYGS
jgi:DNA primase small subunit